MNTGLLFHKYIINNNNKREESRKKKEEEKKQIDNADRLLKGECVEYIGN